MGLIAPPRERKVFLQTMKRRARKGKSIAPAVAPVSKGHHALAELADPLSDRESARATESPNDSTMNLGNPATAGLGVEDVLPNPVPVDVQSQISGESAASNNSARYSIRVADASGESTAGSKHSGQDEREITATVELTKGGYLPGDMIPVKIKVEHNRSMKSLNGIIVTLYRQGRVDYSPPITSFTGLTKEEAKRLERDDYYPRSKTGLGGLSLSSAGSCSVFRKDLSQSVAPLMINPATLTAKIGTSVRVPEDAFPSIRNVPGGLISFKYHVEVIVDLGGRLAGPSGSASQTQHPNRMVSSSVRGGYSIETNPASNWNGAIVDTDHIRREKGVISVSFEVIIGTTDSSKLRGKAVAHPSPLTRSLTHGESSREEDIYDDDRHNPRHSETEDHGDYNGSGFQQPQPRYYAPVTSPQTAHYDFQTHETQAPVYVPPPEAIEEGNLTEKERARRAEQRLLPSQPSLPTGHESTAGPSQSSAPDQSQYASTHEPSAPVLPPETGGENDTGERASAPTAEDLDPDSSQGRASDKQELERQRLLAEASAPPDIPDDYDGAESSAAALTRARLPAWSHTHEPSAPSLDEENENGDHHGLLGAPNNAGASEPLPRYER